MTRSSDLEREHRALRERLSRLTEANLRINESLGFDTVGIGRVDGDIRAGLHRLGRDGRLHHTLANSALVVGPAGVELPDVYAAERE